MPPEGSSTQKGQASKPKVLLAIAKLRQKASALDGGVVCCQRCYSAAQQA